MKNRVKYSRVAALQAAVCLYTISGIAAKLASNYAFLSMGFILCYGAEIAVLGVYAIIWQQIIKRVDISIAYANRAMALLWSAVWAVVLFHVEQGRSWFQIWVCRSDGRERKLAG